MTLLQFLSRTALASFVAASCFSLSANACPVTVAPVDTTFTFVGNCTDCIGTGVGTLVVQNYTPGEELTDANLVSFSYVSSILNFEIVQGTLPSGPDANVASVETPGGKDEKSKQKYGKSEIEPVDYADYFYGFLENTPGSYDVDVQGYALDGQFYDFNSSDTGEWYVDSGKDLADYGPTSNYSIPTGATPEPSSLALLGSGLAAIAALRRRLAKVA